MRKAQQKVRDAAMMVTCLAMMAGCSQGDRNELGQSAGVGAEAGPGQLELQGPVANLPVGSGAEGERVLVQEYKGMVVRSERDEAGTVRTTVHDGDQQRLLFEQHLRLDTQRVWIRHPKLGLEVDEPLDLGTAPLSLSATNLAALRVYGLMPPDKDVTTYGDYTGCDWIADPIECTGAGKCCDRHDYCYDVYGCNATSWLPLVGSSACKGCNSQARDCIILSVLGHPQGKSSCCGTDSKANNCDLERPDCCRGHVQRDGTCDCSACDGTTQSTPVCNPSPPDPPDGGTGGTGGTGGSGGSGGSGGTGDAPCVVCRPPPGEPGPSKSGSVPRPVDPNDKVGPGTPEVSRAEVLPYQINFENQDGATASAQEVVVVDYLDPSLDWATVDFGEIHYGGRTIAIPVGAMDFTVLDAPVVDGCVLFGQGSLAVRVTLSMDLQTGRFEARLKVIDPATNEWPEDPYAGILPPGLGSCSQGHVTFTAMVKSTAEAGTLIKNKADIVFDNNAPITTNEVSNTLLD